jgi:hypothetical protein
MRWSTAGWSSASMPMIAGPSLSLTFSTAFEHALAEVALLVAVAQLDGLVLAGRRAARHGGAAEAARCRGTSASTVGLPRESRIRAR